MSLSRRFIVFLFRALTHSIFRIHGEQLSRVPQSGPLILVTNHINILEIPVIYEQLQPRPLHGLVLSSRWKNPIVAWGLNTCGTIPLKRGGINLENMQRTLDVLKNGEFVIISPEGTRSRDGQLQKAQTGVVLLALRSGAPLLPVAFHGSEGYKANLKKLCRTDFYIEVGEPFRLEAPPGDPDREERRRLADEIMVKLAALLPVEYRGEYK